MLYCISDQTTRGGIIYVHSWLHKTVMKKKRCNLVIALMIKGMLWFRVLTGSCWWGFGYVETLINVSLSGTSFVDKFTFSYAENSSRLVHFYISGYESMNSWLDVQTGSKGKPIGSLPVLLQVQLVSIDVRVWARLVGRIVLSKHFL